jgi:hypothetical protein
VRQLLARLLPLIVQFALRELSAMLLLCYCCVAGRSQRK